VKGRWINVALGVWLSATAALFSRGGAALTNNLFLGLSIFLVAFMAMGVDNFRRINTMLGAWAVVSPFLLGYGVSGAAMNDVLVGILVVSTSLWAPHEPDRRAHRPAV
jgi:hypothetical protein